MIWNVAGPPLVSLPGLICESRVLLGDVDRPSENLSIQVFSRSLRTCWLIMAVTVRLLGKKNRSVTCLTLEMISWTMTEEENSVCYTMGPPRCPCRSTCRFALCSSDPGRGSFHQSIWAFCLTYAWAHWATLPHWPFCTPWTPLQ